MRLTALLVHAPKTTEYYPLHGVYDFINFMPMGLFAVASEAERAGHHTRIVHLGLARRQSPAFSLSRLVRDAGVTTVGFSLHWHHQAAAVLGEMARLKNEIPAVRIIVGGLTASRFAQELVEHWGADAVVCGEGERSFAEILSRAPGESLEGVPNLVRRQGDEIAVNAKRHAPTGEELSSYNFCDESLLLYPGYPQICRNPWIGLRGFRRPFQNRLMTQDARLFPLMTIRGCPHNCAFCGGAARSYDALCARRKTAIRTSESALATLDAAAKNGFTGIFMEYIDEPRAHEEAIGIVEGMTGMAAFDNLVVECRVEPREEFLRSMGAFVRRGRRARVHLSPDIGSETRRREYKSRAMSDERISTAAEFAAEMGVGVEVYFLLGLPGETDGERDELAGRARAFLAGGCVEAVRLNTMTVEPGSSLFENPEQFGALKTMGTLDDYRAMHAVPRWPPPTGLAAIGDDPHSADRVLQNLMCARFCRMANWGDRRNLISSGTSRLAAALCRRRSATNLGFE